MTHKGTQPIRTERLLLRRIEPADAPAMYANWASDPRVSRFLSWEPHVSPEATAAVIAGWLPSYDDPAYYSWFIELDGELIGNISVHDISDKHRRCELGYCLGQRWWGRGIMSEAARAVIAFLFGEVGMHRVTARHQPENPASGAVMRKAGMTFEGTLRDHLFGRDGRFHDLDSYAILNPDA